MPPLLVIHRPLLALFCPITNSEIRLPGESRIVRSTPVTMGVIVPSGLRYSTPHGGNERSENVEAESLSPAMSMGQRTPLLLCFVILLVLSTNLNSDARVEVSLLGRALYRPHERSENARANLPWEPGN